MSLILIHEPRRGRTDWYAGLKDDGHEVVLSHGRQALLEALAARRPDAIVYVMGDLVLDLGVLWLVRRIAPALPFILLGGPAGLDARRSVQELRPTYYGMFPLEPSELGDAVRAALGQESGRRVAS